MLNTFCTPVFIHTTATTIIITIININAIIQGQIRYNETFN